MAKRGADQVGFFLIDGYDVLGVSTQLEDNLEAILQEATPFGAGWEVQAATGLKRASLTQEGFYDTSTGSSNAALSGQQGVNRLLCYGLEGNTVGQHFVGYQGALQVEFVRIASRGELHRANARYEGNGEVEEGVILHTHTVRTAAGDTESTAVDNGAQTTGGGAAYLQVSDLTLGGHTNLVVTVRQSDDGTTWEDLTSFTAVTSAPAKERKALSGTIKRYLAVSWTFAGSGTPSAKFFVGLDRK